MEEFMKYIYDICDIYLDDDIKLRNERFLKYLVYYYSMEKYK